MCEWLVRGEWCDVKLLCGGRTFNAHRAVLATVSPFLKKLLLSCPDESETFIVLPDIDLDAMSSVLYYIYNGEVSIQMHKQKKFLEVMKTLQIFIELQYLPDQSHFFNDLYNHESKFKDRNDIDVFTLQKETDCKNKNYINLKKGTSIQDALHFYKCIENPRDKRNEDGDSYKMQLLEGRQKSFNQRDIEKYPQNGYCNGVTEHVMEISNRFYLEPSKPLMNANDVLREDKTLSETFRMPENAHLNMKLSQNVCKTYMTKSSTNLLTDYHNGPRKAQNLWLPHTPLLPISILPEVKDNNILQKHTTSLDLSSQSISLHQTSNSNCLLFSQKLARNCLDTKINETHNDKSKYTGRRNKMICNQVLQNPWCPRQPNNYRAFKRKTENDITQKVRKTTKGCNYNLNSSSDSNNNINNMDTTLLSETKKYKEVFQEISPLLFDQDPAPPNDSVYKKESTGRYNCEECSKTFSQLRNYKYHMSIHRGTKEFAATCSICGKYFNDRGYLSSHMKIHRNRKEYKCPQCPKSFNQRVAYNMHVRIHTGIKPHVCDECGKAFSRKMLLKQHYRTHSGERPYACPHCDKRFADRSNMTLHLRLHTGVKPFSCTMCPKSFTKKHHLKSHLNFHTGAKPYSCPRCNLAFTQSSNMRTHLKKCTAPVAPHLLSPNK